MKKIRMIIGVAFFTGCIMLFATYKGCGAPPQPPLATDQQGIAERLEKTVHGDLVYDVDTGMIWRVYGHRGIFLIIEHIMDGDTATRITKIEEVVRWADVVTNGLSADPRYCQLAEMYLTSEK